MDARVPGRTGQLDRFGPRQTGTMPAASCAGAEELLPRATMNGPRFSSGASTKSGSPSWPSRSPCAKRECDAGRPRCGAPVLRNSMTPVRDRLDPPCPQRLFQNVNCNCTSTLRLVEFGAPPCIITMRPPRLRYWPKYGDDKSPSGGVKLARFSAFNVVALRVN